MCSNPEFTEIHWQADHWRGRRADSYHSTECRSLCRCRDGPSCRDCTPSYARRCGERAGQGRSVKTYLKRVTVPSGCCLSSQPVQKVFNRWWQRFAENHFNVMAVTTATPTRGCIGLNCLGASSPIGDRRHPHRRRRLGSSDGHGSEQCRATVSAFGPLRHDSILFARYDTSPHLRASHDSSNAWKPGRTAAIRL